MARGVDGRDIFIEDRDRYDFLNALERISRQTNTVVIAYCLMGNHFHLVIKVDQVTLSSAMQRLLTGHALTFNSRHGRAGHLFQARHQAKLCLDDAYLTALIRYIHLNPVRAKLVAHPRDWPWSSFRDFEAAGLDGLAGNAEMPDFDPWKKESTDHRPTLLRHANESSLSLPEIGASISSHTGLSVGELCSGSRRHPIVVAKNLLIQEALREGHRPAAIAEFLGITRGAVTHYLREKLLT